MSFLSGKIFNKNTWQISAFFSLLLLRLLFTSSTLELTNFQNLFTGIATFDLMDVSARVGLFYKMVLLSFIGFSGIWFLFTNVFSWVKNKMLWKFLKITSLIGIALILLEVLTKNHEETVYFIIAIQATFVIYIFGPKSDPIVPNFIWRVGLALSISFLFRETAVILFDCKTIYPITEIFLLTFILNEILLRTLIKKCDYSLVVYSLIPLFLIPIVSVLSDELYLITNQRNIPFLSPDKTYLVMIGLLLAMVCYRYFKAAPDYTISANRFLKRRMYYFLIAGLALFALYEPIIHQSNDMFELANPANALMRMFQFGEVPFIQFVNSHLLSELFFKSIYTLLNGYNRFLDFSIYDCLNWVVFYLAGFWLLKTTTKSYWFALAIIVFIPFLDEIVYFTFYTVVITAYFLLRLLKDYSYKNITYLILWDVLVIFWRLDAGIPNLYSSIIILALIIFQKKDYKTVFKTGGILAVSVISGIVLFGLVYLIYGDSLFLNLKQSISYFGASQAHAYTKLSSHTDRFLFNQYFIFPSLIIGITIYSLIHFFRNNKSLNKKNGINWVLLLFFSFVYLFNFPRGLVRHSLTEGADGFINSFFYLIVGLFLFQLIKQKSRARIAVFALFLLVVPNFKYPNGLDYSNLFHSMYVKFQKPMHIEKQPTKIERCIADPAHAKKSYTGFVSFMDANFPDTATFLDFSNSPMLYFYAQRQVPSYFCQYMQNTVTEFVQNENVKHLQKFDVPIVVFSHIPEEWWDHTDGVPNTLRYLPISQHIFKNYLPLGQLNGYSLWMKKGQTLTDSAGLKPFSLPNQNFDLKLFPYALAGNQALQKEPFDSINAWQSDGKIRLDTVTSRFNNYLLLTISANASCTKEVELCYGDSLNNGIFRFTLYANGKSNQYSVPLSCQYNWVARDWNRLRIKLPKNASLNKVEFKTQSSKR
jgi:hypothetical protein